MVSRNFSIRETFQTTQQPGDFPGKFEIVANFDEDRNT